MTQPTRDQQMKPRKAIKAEFGRVALLRAVCPRCKRLALVIQGKMACCGANPVQNDEYIKKKESEGKHRRDDLGRAEKRSLIINQEGQCFYCGNPFGTPVYKPEYGKVVVPGIHFDHFVCWDYSRDTSVGNMVASCAICNLIKSNKIFANAEDARAFVRHRIVEKGYEFHLDPDRKWENMGEIASRRRE